MLRLPLMQRKKRRNRCLKKRSKQRLRTKAPLKMKSTKNQMTRSRKASSSPSTKSSTLTQPTCRRPGRATKMLQKALA